MITVMALLDTIGVASILPFIAVLTNPDIIETNVILSKAFKHQANLELELVTVCFRRICFFTFSYFTYFQSHNNLCTNQICSDETV